MHPLMQAEKSKQKKSPFRFRKGDLKNDFLLMSNHHFLSDALTVDNDSTEVSTF